MTNQIRKDFKMDDLNKGGVRRSGRDRVPNNKYIGGIEDLKRSMNGKEGRGRNERNPNSEESSWSHRKVDDEEYRAEPGDSLKCSITDADGRARLIDIQVVLNKPLKRKNSEVPEMRMERRPVSRVDDDVSEPRKITKKPSEGPSSKSSLLHILMEAAKKAAGEPKAQSNSEVSAKQANNSQDEYDYSQPEDTEGRITKVSTEPGLFVFEHSRNGRIEMPATEQSKKQNSSTDQTKEVQVDILKRYFDEYKRKIHIPLILS